MQVLYTAQRPGHRRRPGRPRPHLRRHLRPRPRRAEGDGRRRRRDQPRAALRRRLRGLLPLRAAAGRPAGQGRRHRLGRRRRGRHRPERQRWVRPDRGAGGRPARRRRGRPPSSWSSRRTRSARTRTPPAATSTSPLDRPLRPAGRAGPTCHRPETHLDPRTGGRQPTHDTQPRDPPGQPARRAGRRRRTSRLVEAPSADRRVRARCWSATSACRSTRTCAGG